MYDSIETYTQKTYTCLGNVVPTATVVAPEEETKSYTAVIVIAVITFFIFCGAAIALVIWYCRKEAKKNAAKRREIYRDDVSAHKNRDSLQPDDPENNRKSRKSHSKRSSRKSNSKNTSSRN